MVHPGERRPAHAAVPEGAARGTPGGDRWWLVAATGIAIFMAQLDGTVVIVALPSIEHDFGIGTSLTEWVVLAYVLPLIAMSLPSGRWLDTVGHRPALLFSVTGFLLASVAVGAAPNFGLLIAARVLQGGFGALLFALVPVLTTIAVRPEVRGRAMGIVMMLGPLGGVSGPALGGLLIEHVGWPWIFYLNVPVGLLVMGIGLAQLPAGARLRVPDRSWWAETGLVGIASAVLMVALSLTASDGALWLLLAPLAIPFALLWRRRPGSAPVIELLRVPGMLAPHAALLTEIAAVMAVQFLVPFHLQLVVGAGPAEVGMVMLAFPLAVLIIGPIGGWLADRWHARTVSIIGVIMVSAGVLSLVPLGDGWGSGDLIWRLAVAGAGAGLFAGPNQVLAMSTAPRRLLGTTGASTSFARQIGIALGPALATAVWALGGHGVDGMRFALGAAAGLAVLSLFVLLRPAARAES